MPTERVTLAAVSPAAHDAWYLFAATHGLEVTSLLEVLGPALVALDEARPPRWLRPVIREARQMASERRRRQ